MGDNKKDLKSRIGTSEDVILMFFSCFFQDLCEFVTHFHIKRHIFLCLFVLFAQH